MQNLNLDSPDVYISVCTPKGAHVPFSGLLTDLRELHLAASRHHALHLFQLVDGVNDAVPWSKTTPETNKKVNKKC